VGLYYNDAEVHKKTETIKTIIMKQILFLTVLLISSQVFPQQNTTYEIYAIEFAKIPFKVPVSEIAINPKTTDSIRLNFMIWLLKGNNGKSILVDAGFHKSPTDSVLAGYIQPDITLQRINVNPNDITDIILTHPHWDHIGGIDLFPNAIIWMQKKDYDYFVDDAWQQGGKKEGFDSLDVLKIVEKNIRGKVRLVNGDSVEIMPGIRVFIGSKHTYESQYVLVNSPTDKVLLASDNIWFYYNLEHMISIPLTFDPQAYVKQMQRMKTLVKYELIIPGHSAEVMEKFPKVTDGVVRIR